MVGIGVDYHRDLACKGFFEQITAGILLIALFEPSGSIELNGTAGFLHFIKDTDGVGIVEGVVHHTELFGQVKVSDKGVKTGRSGTFQLFPVTFTDLCDFLLRKTDPILDGVVNRESV